MLVIRMGRYLFGNRLGLVVHSIIFSLVHIRLNIDFSTALSLLFGLFLLGLVLGVMRMIDKGYLWGCVVLHGGLVGGWFVISSGLVEFSPHTPGWLFGPGGTNLNPIGGLLAVFALATMLFSQRTAFAMAGPPCRGARNASSKGAAP